MPERTLVLIKPDGVVCGYADDIKRAYEEAGFCILHEQLIKMTFRDAQEFYAEHQHRRFFNAIALFMSAGDCVLLVLEGEDPIKSVRKLNGATDPKLADEGTIRQRFRSAGGPCNTVHASDSQDAFVREVAFMGRYSRMCTMREF